MFPPRLGLNIEESRPKSSITRLKPGWKWNPRSKSNKKTAQKPLPNPFPPKRSLIPRLKHFGCHWLHAKLVAYRLDKRDTALQRQRFSRWPHEPRQPHAPRQYVVPAQAGIQWSACDDWVPACAGLTWSWVPACAGMTWSWVPACAGMTDKWKARSLKSRRRFYVSRG